jgi:alpha-glucosidase
VTRWLATLGLAVGCAEAPVPPARTDVTLACPDGDLSGEAPLPSDVAFANLEVAFLPGGGIELRPEGARASLARVGPATAAATLVADGVLHACDDRWHVAVTALGDVTIRDGDTLRWRGRAETSGWRVPLDPEATLRGAGERTGVGERRGRTLRFRNTDAFQAACQGWCPDDDPLYLSLPSLLHASGGVVTGWITDTPAGQTWVLGDDAVMTADDGLPTFLWFPGPTPTDVAQQRHAALGAPARWPAWGFGWHQSRWGWVDDDAVRSVYDGYRSRGWPLASLWFDIQAMDGFRSFTWDPVAFDGRRALLDDLHADDVRAVAILDPGLKADDAWPLWREAVEGGLLLGGLSPYLGEVWPGRAGFPDFTSPATRTWWADAVTTWVDDELDGVWIDMNEPSDFVGPGGSVPDTLAVDGDGVPTTMAWAHNAYANFEADATVQGVRAAHPDRLPFVLSRAGYLGLHRFAGAWTGDAPSTWATLQATAPMLTGLSISGLPYVGSDVGGYCCDATPELYARWLQLGLFSPFFRGHSATNARRAEPWTFGDEVEAIAGEILRLRSALIPTFVSLSDAAVVDGVPLLRPLWWDHVADSAAWTQDDVLALGPWIVAAPVLQQGAASRTLTLPSGRWLDPISAQTWTGPTTVTFPTPLGALPWFLAEGAIVFRADRFDPAEAPVRVEQAGVASIDLVPGATPTSAAWIDTTASGAAFSRRVTHLAAADGAWTFAVDAPSPADVDGWTGRTVDLRLRPMDARPGGVTLNGATVPEIEAPDAFDTRRPTAPVWWWDASARAVRIRVLDTATWTVSVAARATWEARETIPMPFEVQIPSDTPADATVTLASNATGWQHVPMTRTTPTTARLVLDVPRGTWIDYKYARGGWDTVEKWPGCVEATNRYEHTRAGPPKRDVVWAWADRCP